MKKFAEPEDREWDGKNKHWTIFSEYGCVYAYYYTSQKNLSCIYFESYEKAKECIKVIGEDRIKKFYTGIKE